MWHCAVSARTNWPYGPDLSYVDGLWYAGSEHQTLKRDAQTTMKLFTGGKKVPKRENLWVLQGSATEVLDPWSGPAYLPPGSARSVAFTNITLGELGKLGSDGLRYKVLPDGETKDVTPKVDGVNYFGCKNGPGPTNKVGHSVDPGSRK